MKDKEELKALYFHEQNLLKSTAEKLIESSNEIIHDNILSLFDNIDEVNRLLYNYLLKEKMIIRNRVSNKKQENIYNELDSMYLRINE